MLRSDVSLVGLVVLLGGGFLLSSEHTNRPHVFDEMVLVNNDREVVLDLIIRDLLTKPDFQPVRDFYGTPGETTVGLATDSRVPWPAGYQTIIPGFQFVYRPAHAGEYENQNRMLGFEIIRLRLPGEKPAKVSEGIGIAPIAVRVFNIGGEKNGPAGGGSFEYFEAVKKNGQWEIGYWGSAS